MASSKGQGAVQLNALAPLVLRREMGTDRRPAQRREREGLREVAARRGSRSSLWSVLWRTGRKRSWVRMRVVASDHLVHVSVLAAELLKDLKSAESEI